MHVTEPVLWRRPGEVQVGVSAARILTGLEPTEIDLLLDLAVPRSAQWLARELTVRGIPSARWEKIRSSLPAPARSTPVRRGSVLLLDSHPLTVQVGHLLAERGVRVITESVGRSGRTRDRVPSRRPALAVLTDSWVTDPVRVGNFTLQSRNESVAHRKARATPLPQCPAPRLNTPAISVPHRGHRPSAVRR